jgi:hypothetical protein
MRESEEMRNHTAFVTAVIISWTLLPAMAAVAQRTGDSNAVERAFAPGGTVRLDLGAGEYRITGTAEEKVRVRWSTQKPEDARRVRVSADVAGKTATVRTSGPNNGFRVEIEIPERSHVDLDLSAGEITMRRVEGSKNISMWAGEASIEIGDPARYRRVDASVRFGEIGARPFNVNKGGIFRSFHWNGNGEYTLRARIFAGELQLLK